MNTKSRFFAPAALALAAIVLVACGARAGQSLGSQGNAALDYDGFVAALRKAGAEVEVVDENISQPFLSAPGCLIRVNGHDVQAFDYADEAAASEEVGLVSPDGSSVGTTMVSWIAIPHFYQQGRIIVLYVGEDAAVLATLENTLGSQVAGG